MNVFDRQVGGEHYKNMPIPVTQFIHANGFGFIVGNIIKYAVRYGVCGNTEDLQKIIHYAQIAEKGTDYEIRSTRQMLGDVKQSNPTGSKGHERELPVRDLQGEEAVERDASRPCGVGAD